ncbi:ribosome biogenesis GTP-binding protein YsxC [Helicobacter sp. 13S00401-1]|nr:ribosome biogenesis GTP-binding protein YsxC [Helicobacter sp. 13S00401-1]
MALLGRSNVGKSSLINSLLASNLAKKSNTPGKTRHINFYSTRWSFKDTKEEEANSRVSFDLNLLDLPGFGYAKVSKSEKDTWDKSLDNFLRKRSSIKLFCHLVDSRHTNLKQDETIKAYLESLLRGDQKLLTIYTKVDKLTKSEFLKLKHSMDINSTFISNVKKDPLVLQSLCQKMIHMALNISFESNK